MTSAIPIERHPLFISLRSRLDSALRENDRLRDALAWFHGQDRKLARPLADFTRMEQRVLLAFGKREVCTREFLYSSLYWDRHDCELPEPDKIIDVLLCRIRKKTPKRDFIVNHFGGAWSLTPEGRAWLQSLIAEEKAA